MVGCMLFGEVPAGRGDGGRHGGTVTWVLLLKNSSTYCCQVYWCSPVPSEVVDW